MANEKFGDQKKASAIRLVISRGETAGKVFTLQEGANLIGRWDPDYGSFPEVDLESHDPEAKVSRRHAVIECQGDKVALEDLGSLNGTFVNRGTRLQQGTKHELNDGDEIIVGKTFLRLEFDAKMNTH